MTDARPHIDALAGLAEQALSTIQKMQAGIDAVAKLVAVPPPLELTKPIGVPEETKAALATVIRSLYGPMTQAQWSAIEAVLDGDPAGAETGSKTGLTREDYEWAVRTLGLTGKGYAKIRAVDEVESNNGGMMEAQSAILMLDGPGGFIDGSVLPKILFEAHWFDKFTNGKYRASHPNLSSAKWNKALYVGGHGEWERLHKAMQLDEEAALKSASWGRYQIMGFNHVKAGYPNVRAFVDAMKQSERKQLEAFVNFVKNEGNAAKLNNIGAVPAMNNSFTAWYNGTGQVDKYSQKIATAFAKYD